MRTALKTLLGGLRSLVRREEDLYPEGPEYIARVGHREFVGGLWDTIGQLQFDFLRAHGLRPGSYLLDIACGSLRLGSKAIPFLDRGHYLGIEKEGDLVAAGLEKELDPSTRAAKEPNIVVSDSFEFEKLGQIADIAIAQSLFTHLGPSMIGVCFEKLRPWLRDDGVFFATFFESEQKLENPEHPHPHIPVAYTRGEMLAFGEQRGYRASYIGDWNHPRKQVIVEYRKR